MIWHIANQNPNLTLRNRSLNYFILLRELPTSYLPLFLSQFVIFKEAFPPIGLSALA